MKPFRKGLITSLLIILPLMASGQDLQYYVGQGALHYELQEYEQAIDFFSSALQYPSPPKEVYAYLASSYLLTDKPDKAVDIASEGLEEHSEFLRLRLLKGEAFIKIDPVKAIPVFGDIYSMIEDDSVDSENVSVNLIKAYLGQLHQQVGGNAFERDEQLTAISHFEKARSYTPDSLSVHNNLAYLYIKNEQWKKAAKTAEEALVLFPANENLLFMKAQAYENKNDPENLLLAAEQLYISDPENIDKSIMYGRALLNNNKARQANAFFQKKIEENPHERRLYRTLIEINRQRMNQGGLLKILELKLVEFPDDRNLLEEYGRELIAAGKTEAAHAHFDSLSTLYNSAEFARVAARAYLYEPDFDRAKTSYKSYLKIWADDPGLLGDYALILKEAGDLNQSKSTFQKYLLVGSDPWILLQYASIIDLEQAQEELFDILRESKYSGFTDWLEIRANELKPNSTEEYVDILSNLFNLYEQTHKTVNQDAESGLNELMLLEPELFTSFTRLSFINTALEELLVLISEELSFETALSILDRTGEIHQNSAILNHYLGVLYYEKSYDLTEAKQRLETAVRLSPDHEISHLVLGHLYSELNELDRAILSYERVLSLNNQNREAYRSIIQLSQMNDDLDSLCERWSQRYRQDSNNDLLRDFLIEALHRANRFEEAKKVLESM
ncbi:MAG: tetratricopeptide repeat protein [Balneolaceae bacterium]|nr:tetratricopeptide repeat protein [Balneolaceae bacterium]